MTEDNQIPPSLSHSITNNKQEVNEKKSNLILSGAENDSATNKESEHDTHLSIYANEDKDMSSDELVIDLGLEENEKKTVCVKKRKRKNVSESSSESIDLTEEFIEVDKNVSAVAAKNNLTSESVKKILKKVILNEHVLAIVQLREEEVQSETKAFKISDLKLTRAKTRELKKSAKADVPWPLPITPVKVPLEPVLPEVKTLISEDLLDEESDDEYQPTQEEHSDDERDIAEQSSDFDSQPQTPATPDIKASDQISEDHCESSIKYSDDGLFKIPKEIEKNIDTTEEATIALRTRSKLCLSDTPIEKIEESFIPPDISFDDTFEIDYIWRDFLQDLPNSEQINNEDDDEADPEYNVAADKEPFDIEELREDDEVEVSNKELNELVSELFDGIDDNFDIDHAGMSNDLITSFLQTDEVYSNYSCIPFNTLNASKKDVYNEENNIYSYNTLNTVTNINNENNMSNEHNSTTGKISIKEKSYSDDISSKNEYVNNSIGKNIEFSSPQPEIVINIVNNEKDNDKCPSFQIKIGEKKKIIDSPNESQSENIENISVTNDLSSSYDYPVSQRKKMNKKPLFEMREECKDWFYNDKDINFLPEQRLLLEQQMRQHVQLITQIFLQLHGHHELWAFAPKQKEYLISLKHLSDNKSNSAFRSSNLLPAIELCDLWTHKLSENTQEMKSMFEFIKTENQKIIMSKKKKRYRGKFHPEFFNIILNSKNVFYYPELFPLYPFRTDDKIESEFIKPEESLIAIGLEEFYCYMIFNDKIVVTQDNLRITAVVDYLNKYLLPCRCPKKLKIKIKHLKHSKEDTPIKYFYANGKAPKTVNNILPYESNSFVKDLPLDSLPNKWQQEIKMLNKNKVPLSSKKPPDTSNEPVRDDSEILNISSSTSKDNPTYNIRSNETHITRFDSSVSNTAQVLECILQKLRDSPCECINSALDSVPWKVPRDQTFITDYFRPKNHNKIRRTCKNKNTEDTKISHRLKCLFELCEVPQRVEVFSSEVLIHSFINVRNRFLQKIQQVDEMLPSMPFLSVNSETSNSPLPESTNESNANISNIEKESSEVGKENAVSKKVLEDKNRSSKSNVSVISIRQKPPSKAQREQEANKAMFSNNDPSTDEIRDATFATAYFEKVKLRLKCNRPNSGVTSKFEIFLNILNDFDSFTKTPCDLYHKLKDLFGTENADLTEEFLTFLTPGQATEVGRFMDYFMLSCMSDFIERLQIFFANKPAQLRKILWCLENLVDKPEKELTVDAIKIVILPLLKGNQYLIDWFLKLFPEEKPPESLTNNGYEVMDLENMNDSEEPLRMEHGYEVLNVPNTNENYGNDLCTCACHNLTSEKFKNRLRHCLACGTKYIQGRMYAQHGRALRSVFLNWEVVGEVDQTRRLSSTPSPRQGNSRKRTASVDPQNSTSSLSKADSDEERVSPKRSGKLIKTPTSKGKKSVPVSKSLLKTNENNEFNQIKSCSKNILKSDENIEPTENKNNTHSSEILATSLQDSKDDINNEIDIVNEPIKREHHSDDFETIGNSDMIPEHDQNDNFNNSEENIKSAGSPLSVNFTVSDIESPLINSPIKHEKVANWTREEDKILLLILRDEVNSEFPINKIQELLPHKTLENIRKRCENVMSLLQKL